MSVITFRADVAATTTVIRRVEVGRSFLHAGTFYVLSAVALTQEIQLRVFSQGNTIAPMMAVGADNFIYLIAQPLRIEFKRDVNGPPYELELNIYNPTAGAVSVSGSLEVYNTPYPQTRLYIVPGKEGDNPFSALYAGVKSAKDDATKQEEKDKKKMK